MKRAVRNRAWAMLCGCALLGGCERAAAPAAQEPPAAALPTASAPVESAPAQVQLDDVLETAPTHMVGVSYPEDLAGESGLARELQGYVDRARAELTRAVEARGPEAPPYDLTLAFTTVYESPELIAVAADGSTYTGGEASRPLVARFVWLRNEDRLLTARDLVPDAESWSRLIEGVRAQLRTAYAQRIEADGMPLADRSAALRSASERIERGTAPGAAESPMFEPVAAPDGRIGGLRFVFPAAQLSTGLHGTQTVELPVADLLPHVAPAYQKLFSRADG